MQGFLYKIAACLVAAASATQAAPSLSAPISAGAGAQLAFPDVAAHMTAGMNLPQPVTDARQAILEGLLTSAHQQVAANPQTATAQPTLGALVGAHIAYAQLVQQAQASGVQPNNAAAPGTAGVDPSAQQAAAKALMDSVVAHYATAPDAQQQIESLMQTNSQFAAAATTAAAGRDDECDMLTSIYKGQFGKISEATKECMCNLQTPYVLCRAMMANDLNTETIKTMQSTITDKRMERIAKGHPGGMNVPMASANQSMVDKAWQPSYVQQQQSGASSPSLLSRRQAEESNKGPAIFDPTSGKFSAEVCAGEIVEVCVRGELDVPIFDTVKSAAGNYLVNQISNGNTQSSDSLATFLASDTLKGLAEDTKAELDISICLGLPGLTEVLNEVGISLCIDLLRADLFFLQGPTGQLSTGLDLLIVNLSAWYKYKFANGSPVCPQDLNKDMFGDICPNEDLYQKILANFVDEDFCNLEAGQGIFGAEITLDLFFYSTTWQFGDMPPTRDPILCVGGQPEDPGFVSFFDTKVCGAAEEAYLAANGDVKSNLEANACSDPNQNVTQCLENGARGHWLASGRNEYYRQGAASRRWPGEKCIDQTIFCWEAQVQFWADNMDVADDMMYGPDLNDASILGMYTNKGYTHNSTVPRDGAWQYFQANKANNDKLLWRGDLCDAALVAQNKQYGNGFDPIIDDASARAYLARYPDIMVDGADRKTFFWDSHNNRPVSPQAVAADYWKYGREEGRLWG